MAGTPLHMRVVIVPWPQAIREGAKPEEQEKWTTLETIGPDLTELFRVVNNAWPMLFDEGGAVTLLIQKPRIRSNG